MESSRQQIYNLVNDFRQNIDVPRIKSFVKEYVEQHPILSLYITFFSSLFFLPILTFICFAIATIALSFMGMIIIEGFILTTGAIILGFILMFLAVVAVCFSTSLAFMWYIFQNTCKLLKNPSDKSSCIPNVSSTSESPNMKSD